MVGACARTEHVPVDVQVDVLAPLPDDAAWVRLCVTDGVDARFAATDGRFALTGLFPAGPHEVTADVLDASEAVFVRAGPVLVEDGYATVGLDACDACTPCAGSGDRPPEGQPSWVLGLRFSG